MSQIITQALVLRRADYSEYDRMVTLFSPDMGRIDAIARGCRRPKSPLMNAVEPFTRGEYQLFERRGRYAIEQCQIAENYYELRMDYERLTHGAYWLRLLEAALVADTPAKDLFVMTLRALAHLNWGDKPLDMITMAFEMHFIALNGLQPRMDVCLKCGRPVEGDARFDVRQGGVVCLDCPSRAPLIHNGARRIVMKLPRTAFDKYELLEGRPDWPEAARHFRGYVNEKMHLERFAPALTDPGQNR